MKSYAVLFAPEFRLQATVRHQPEWAVEPLALVDALENKPVVVEMNRLARAQRVEGGLTPTQALARCPHLRLLAPNAGHERSAQETMLQLGETLSPFLESTSPGVVTIELPVERGFREAELAQRLVLPLRALGLDARVGVAATPDLALLAARLADPVRIVAETRDFLSPLPVAALEPGRETAFVLDSWGIHTIGQFLALPAAETWARLGRQPWR
jgi:protein ImuB